MEVRWGIIISGGAVDLGMARASSWCTGCQDGRTVNHGRTASALAGSSVCVQMGKLLRHAAASLAVHA